MQEGDYVVFSDYLNGNIISYAGKKNFINSNFAYAPNLRERISDFGVVVSSRNIDITDEILNKYNIRYILVDSKMRADYFVDNEDGLLFILKYSPLKFSPVFDNEDVEIWERLEPENNVNLTSF